MKGRILGLMALLTIMFSFSAIDASAQHRHIKRAHHRVMPPPPPPPHAVVCPPHRHHVKARMVRNRHRMAIHHRRMAQKHRRMAMQHRRAAQRAHMHHYGYNQ